MLNQNPAPKVEAPGHASRPFSQKEWGYNSVSCLCCDWGVVASQELSLIVTTHETPVPGMQILQSIRTGHSRGIHCLAATKTRTPEVYTVPLWEVIVL